MHMTILMINTLAIEGEEGSNPELYWRMHAAYERLWQDGVLRDGASFEGMGHNNGEALQMLLMMARRGSNVFASRTVRRFIAHFYAAVTEPWGWRHGTDGIPVNNYVTNAGSFTWDETNGGVGLGPRHVDVDVIKYLYPTDPLVDWVYRTEMANCSRLDGQPRITDKWGVSAMLYRAIVAEDWNQPATSWEDQQAALGSLEQANLTRFFFERGLLVSRSDWTVNATQLLYQPRSIRGGHTLADHGKIALAANGRWWSPYKSISSAAVHQAASVVFIDGHAGSALPVRVVSVYESGHGTFAVADARLSYVLPLLTI